MGSQQQKRTFRIEKYLQNGTSFPVVAANDFSEPSFLNSDIEIPPSGQNTEIMKALGEIKQELKNLTLPQEEIKAAANALQDATKETATKVTQALSEQEIQEATRLRCELKEIYDAIEETKVDILTIHQSGVNGMEISRVTDELGAIVSGTENATEGILTAAEQIDQSAGDLVAALTDETQQGLASDIQDHVVGIFEACNFQDLTGQRITKVVSTFRFIEERVIHMMEIWGGLDSFDDITPEELEHRKGDKGLLNGPSLEEDEDIASQDDIDALFS
ncbi:MAG: protein phosphatase CheZ [Pseudomonadota bacterium]